SFTAQPARLLLLPLPSPEQVEEGLDGAPVAQFTVARATNRFLVSPGSTRRARQHSIFWRQLAVFSTVSRQKVRFQIARRLSRLRCDETQFVVRTVATSFQQPPIRLLRWTGMKIVSQAPSQPASI